MITAIAQTMKLSSKQEVAGLKEILLPCLMCSAVFKGVKYLFPEYCMQNNCE